MRSNGNSKVILVTFAGRRDRMELLIRYVERAIELGLIDEWHVWDFTRNADDAHWLRARFPLVQLTPSHSAEYFGLPHGVGVSRSESSFRFNVRATNDVHLGLRRIDGDGASYEIVLGGWGNQASVIRGFDDAAALTDICLRDPQLEALAIEVTPGLLPEFDPISVEVSLGPKGLATSVNGTELLRADAAVEPGSFDILYRTGYGANGEWIFSETEESATRLFVSGPAPHLAPDAMFYTRAYQYYGANRERYRNDVFLKCDDDIVFFDVERLRDFIAFRTDNPQYFLVSADVINNGVCAFYQQQSGAIEKRFDEFELPPGGMCGSLWSSGAKAERLHKHFISDPLRFRRASPTPILWRERISINFVSWLGEDLIHIPDIMSDDEHDLCYGVRKRARKINCIYPSFVAAHLSFWKQEEEMDIPAVLAAYARLASQMLDCGECTGKRPVPDDVAIDMPG